MRVKTGRSIKVKRGRLSDWEFAEAKSELRGEDDSGEITKKNPDLCEVRISVKYDLV